MSQPDVRLWMTAVMLTGHFVSHGFCMTQPFADAHTAERMDLVRCRHAGMELRALQGTWAATCGQTDGQKWAPGKVLKFQMTLQGDRYCIVCGPRKEEGTFCLATRKGIDLLPATGAHSGQAIHGIYRAERDRLVICLAGPGAERPTAFSAEEGSEQVLLIFRRVG